jgi:hypothetical protein
VIRGIVKSKKKKKVDERGRAMEIWVEHLKKKQIIEVNEDV